MLSQNLPYYWYSISNYWMGRWGMLHGYMDGCMNHEGVIRWRKNCLLIYQEQFKIISTRINYNKIGYSCLLRCKVSYRSNGICAQDRMLSLFFASHISMEIQRGSFMGIPLFCAVSPDQAPQSLEALLNLELHAYVYFGHKPCQCRGAAALKGHAHMTVVDTSGV